ncbi:dynein axonemal assembly factor 6 [Rhynchophorus ferrugineus]|uniref:dynein axonemal assembly factor 6 n=1 Tax=Rhynchophorus ferrugineus TaxID=354439 RepID=UPI003FCE4DAF
MASNICDIEKLVELFNTCSNEEQDDEEPNNTVNCSSSQRPNQKKNISPYSKIDGSEKREIADVDSDEVYDENGDKTDHRSDWKQCPKWDVSYRQSVSATDVFLGMGFKTPSTSSCENMIVTIRLPGEKRQNIDLKIEAEKLVLVSPKYFLDMNLPHPVDPKKGNAEFDAKEEKLTITLNMDRELDLLNF